MKRFLFSLALVFMFALGARAQSAAFVPSCAGVNDLAKFTAIKSAVGTTTPATIKLSYGKICKITSNLTLTSNLMLDASDGGLIDLTNSSVTLTIQGPVRLPARKVFLNATAGTVSFSGNKSLGPILPQWWGAIADGTTDNLATIKAALVAGAGRNVHFIAGDYLISNSLVVLANTLITGDGYSTRIICPASGWDLSVGTDHFGIFNVKTNNVRITGLRIYGTKTAPIDAGCDGGFARSCHTPKLIYFQDIDGIDIDHTWMENSTWEGIWQGGTISTTLHANISSNHFTGIDGPSAVTGNFERAVVSNNVFQDCALAIGITGRYVTVTSNQIYGATAQGIGVGEIGNGGFVTVTGNIIQMPSTGSFGGVFVTAGSTDGPITISGNNISMADAGNAIRLNGGGNVDISNNSIQGTTSMYGIFCESSATTSNVSVRGNTIILKSESATPNISRGIILIASTGSTLYINSSGNNVIGMTVANSNFAYDYRPTQGSPGTVVIQRFFDTALDGNAVLNTASYVAPNLPLIGVTDTLAKNITAPGIPVAGYVELYVNSANKTLSTKDDAGVVKTVIQPDAGASNNFLTAISTAGVPSKAQPSSANLSDAANIPLLNAANTFSLKQTLTLPLIQIEGAVLSVSSNTIAPTNAIHHCGAGLIKTITVTSGFTSGTIWIIPDAAYTYDGTSNIILPAGGGTAVVGRAMSFTYSSSTAKWYPSY